VRRFITVVMPPTVMHCASGVFLDSYQGHAASAADSAADPIGRATFDALLSALYVAIKVQPAIFHTQGGVLVNGDAQVLRYGGNVVPGRYAAEGSRAAVGISGHGSDGYLAD
jgi:fumarate reductase flavoprotein subunit